IKKPNEKMEKSAHLSLLDDIREWTTKTPDRIAVRCTEYTYSFAQLTANVNRLAAIIRSRNTSSSFVGISATKSTKTVGGMVAIIQAGYAYLPLDTTYPEERIQQMIQDAGIQYVVCKES